MQAHLLCFLLEGEAVGLVPYDICALRSGFGEHSQKAFNNAADLLIRRPAFSGTDRETLCRRIDALLQVYTSNRQLSTRHCHFCLSCPDEYANEFFPLLLINDMAKVFITEFDGKPAFKFWHDKRIGNVLDARDKWWFQLDAIQKFNLWRKISLLIDTTPILAAFFASSNLPLNHIAIKDELDLTITDKIVSKILSQGLAETHLHLSANFSYRNLIRNLLNIESGYLHRLLRCWGTKSSKLLPLVWMFLRLRKLLLQFIFAEKSKLSCNLLREEVNLLMRIENGLNKIGSGDLYVSYDDYITFIKAKKENGLVYSTSAINQSITFDYKYILENDTAFLTYLFKVVPTLEYAVGPYLLLYLQLKNKIFRHIVEEYGYQGFSYFRRRFIEMKQFRVDRKSTLQYLASSKLLKTAEIRISIDKNHFYEAKRKIIEILEEQINILKNRNLLEIGIIIHFVKPNIKKDASIHENRYLYLKKRTIKYIDSACNLMLLLSKVPELNEYVVGLDVANTETSLPNFCFFPPIILLKEAWRLGGASSIESRHSLGITFHAGEYFHDPIVSLFAIDELLDIILLRPGDRIGHGLIIGLDMNWLCTQCGPFVADKEDALLADLWLWKLMNDGIINSDEYTARETRLLTAFSSWLPREYDNQYCPHMGILNIWNALSLRHEAFYYLLLQDEEIIQKMPSRLVREELDRIRNRVGLEISCMFESLRFQKNRSTPKIDDVCPKHLIAHRNCLHRYFFCRESFQYGLTKIHKNYSSREIAILSRIQKYLCNRISQKGVVVEANLTSNWVIAGFQGIDKHPFFNWLDREGDRGLPRLMVSLNTDNPAVFNTTLEMEYALLFNALIENGFSRNNAMNLIETIRQNGIMSSFVKRQVEDIHTEIDKLKLIIEKLENVHENFSDL